MRAGPVGDPTPRNSNNNSNSNSNNHKHHHSSVGDRGLKYGVGAPSWASNSTLSVGSASLLSAAPSASSSASARCCRCSYAQWAAWYRRHTAGCWGTVIVGLFFIGMAIMTFFLVQNADNNSTSTQFREDFVSLAEGLKTQLDATRRAITASRSMMSVKDAYVTLTQAEFENFAQSIGGQIAGIMSIQYSPYVLDADRAAFEARGSVHFSNFRIVDEDTSVSPPVFVTAPSRPSYFPILFDFPYPVGTTFFGFDMQATPVRFAAIEKARDTGEHVVSQGFRLVLEDNIGYLLFVAGYRTISVPSTVTERRNQFFGVTLGVFRVGDLVSFIFGRLAITPDDLSLYIFDNDETTEVPVLYPASTSVTKGSLPAEQGGVRSTSMDMDVGFRSWTLAAVPTQSYVDKNRSSLPEVLLGVILGVGILVTAIIIISINYMESRRLRRIAEHRNKLLDRLLPVSVSRRIQDGEFIADWYESACIFCMNIPNFGAWTNRLPVDDLLFNLNRLFSQIDGLASRHNIEKIKTAVDMYVAASGLFSRSRPDSAFEKMLRFSEDVLRLTQTFQIIERPNFAAATLGGDTDFLIPAVYDLDVQVRIGMAVGEVTAGVVGKTKPQYDMWGSDVNVAERMMQTGKHGFIQMPDSLQRWISDEFLVTERPQEVLVKGSGLIRTIFVTPKSFHERNQAIFMAQRHLQLRPGLPGFVSEASPTVSSVVEEEGPVGGNLVLYDPAGQPHPASLSPSSSNETCLAGEWIDEAAEGDDDMKRALQEEEERFRKEEEDWHQEKASQGPGGRPGTSSASTSSHPTNGSAKVKEMMDSSCDVAFTSAGAARSREGKDEDGAPGGGVEGNVRSEKSV